VGLQAPVRGEVQMLAATVNMNKPMTSLTPGIVTKGCGLHLRFAANGTRRITLETLNAIQ